MAKKTHKKAVPAKRTARPKRKHLTIKEWQKVLTIVKHDLFEHALVSLIYECALRASEPGMITLGDCEDIDKGNIFIRRAKGSTTGWYQGLSESTKGLLLRWIAERYSASQQQLPEHALFPSFIRQKGIWAGISAWSVWRLFHEIATEAKLPIDLQHPHALKHSRVQHLLEAAEQADMEPGWMIQAIAKLVGHKAAMTTIAHYSTSSGKTKAFVDNFTEQVLK